MTVSDGVQPKENRLTPCEPPQSTKEQERTSGSYPAIRFREVFLRESGEDLWVSPALQDIRKSARDGERKEIAGPFDGAGHPWRQVPSEDVGGVVPAHTARTDVRRDRLENLAVCRLAHKDEESTCDDELPS